MLSRDLRRKMPRAAPSGAEPDKSLRLVQQTWNSFGEIDPLWAILIRDGKRDNRWDLSEFLATGEREIQAVLDYALEQMPDLRQERALDFGCGVGRLSQALAQRFREVHGVDIAASMIRRARDINRHGDRCVYHLNVRRDLKAFADRSFDFIYSNITLQHMPAPLAEGYIRELCRLVGPRGLLIFQLPEGLRRPKRGLPALLDRLKHRAIGLYQRRIRGRPVMDMYGVAPATVEEIIRSSGCRLLDRTEDGDAPPEWISHRYCVTPSCPDD